MNIILYNDSGDQQALPQIVIIPLKSTLNILDATFTDNITVKIMVG